MSKIITSKNVQLMIYEQIQICANNKGNVTPEEPAAEAVKALVLKMGRKNATKLVPTYLSPCW